MSASTRTLHYTLAIVLAGVTHFITTGMQTSPEPQHAHLFGSQDKLLRSMYATNAQKNFPNTELKIAMIICETTPGGRKRIPVQDAKKIALTDKTHRFFVNGPRNSYSFFPNCGNLSNALLFDGVEEAMRIVQQAAIASQQVQDWYLMGVEETPSQTRYTVISDLRVI
jgi:hypothetical protein